MVAIRGNASNWRSHVAFGLAVIFLLSVVAWRLSPRYPNEPSRGTPQAPGHSDAKSDNRCAPDHLGRLPRNAKADAERTRCAESKKEEERDERAADEARYGSDIAKQALIVSEYESWALFWQTLAAVGAFLAAICAAYFAGKAVIHTAEGANQTRIAANAAIQSLEESRQANAIALDAQRPMLDIDIFPYAFDIQDGRPHLFYELHLKNDGQQPATLERISHRLEVNRIESLEAAVGQARSVDSLWTDRLFINECRIVNNIVAGKSMLVDYEPVAIAEIPKTIFSGYFLMIFVYVEYRGGATLAAFRVTQGMPNIVEREIIKPLRGEFSGYRLSGVEIRVEKLGYTRRR